jgi:delta1-piperideine-2-carboxylate reductase
MRCFLANGCDEANAAALTRTVTTAERDGSVSHGLFRVPGYVAPLRTGRVNGKAQPKVIDLAPGVVKVDGDRGHAPLAIEVGREPLIERARSQGIAAMSITQMHHFAALWPEVEMLGSAGLCGLACTTSRSYMVPAGGKERLFGTNPISFAWPRKDKPPVVFDMATASMAMGEVMVAARDGHTVPPGTGVDDAGNPTTDPAKIVTGALMPFGGYKGSAIAMLVELLAGPLLGETLSIEADELDDTHRDGGPNIGEFILAIDPSRFGDAEGWADHAEKFFDRMTAQDGVRLPGDRRYANRLRSPGEGVDIQAALVETIKGLCD